MVDVDTIAAYKRTSVSSRLTWSKGRRSSGAVLHSSNESAKLSQWLCHDDSTINIIIRITIIIIITVIITLESQPEILRRLITHHMS